MNSIDAWLVVSQVTTNVSPGLTWMDLGSDISGGRITLNWKDRQITHLKLGRTARIGFKGDLQTKEFFYFYFFVPGENSWSLLVIVNRETLQPTECSLCHHQYLVLNGIFQPYKIAVQMVTDHLFALNHLLKWMYAGQVDHPGDLTDCRSYKPPFKSVR